jgi:hypothetical protein
MQPNFLQPSSPKPKTLTSGALSKPSHLAQASAAVGRNGTSHLTLLTYLTDLTLSM